MPSKRNKENSTFQKSEALYGLTRALRDGRIPESTHEAPASERFLSTGNIIALLEDKYLRLPHSAMREALLDVGLTYSGGYHFNIVEFHDYVDEMYDQYNAYIASLPKSYFTRHKKASDSPTRKPNIPDTTEESELPPEEPV